MKHKKKAVLYMGIVLSILIVMCLYFGEARKQEKELNIIYIGKVMDDSDFWTQCMEGITMAAEEYGVKLTAVAPNTENDYRRQNELIEWAISQQPDAILLTPASYTKTVPMAEKILQNDIGLVLMDSGLSKELGVSMVATDSVRAGARQGEFIRSFLQKEDRIAVVGHVENSSTAIDREKGLRQGLGEEQSKIVDMVFCDSDSEKAYRQLKEIMEAHPEVTVVVGLNEYSAVGAARALKDMGLQKEVRCIGFDSSLEEIRLLEEGVFDGIIIQSPFKMGYLGLETAVLSERGEKTEAFIDSGSELITKENMYQEENQKLLFLFDDDNEIGNNNKNKH